MTMLTAAPHRTLFFTGMACLVAASLGWALHLVARYLGSPVVALDLGVAPIWWHSFLLLFATFPAFVFGFLFTTFPRWMNGPAVPRPAAVATALLLAGATTLWLLAPASAAAARPLAATLACAGLAAGLSSLLRVLIDARQVVVHAIVASIALTVGVVAAGGFAYGVATGNDFVLHFAVRAALWGFLMPVFFTVCHRMLPFFSQNAIPGYVAWRPGWMLVAVVALAWLRLLLGTAGALAALVPVDLALLALTAIAALRWSSRGARGNPLLWSLYVGFAWLPVALLLQTLRDAGFLLTGAWPLGRAPIHALGVGFFGSLLVAMVTRVTLGHSGRPLRMGRLALACFWGVQAAAVSRVASELLAESDAGGALMLAAVLLWLVAIGAWAARHAPIYLAPRSDGQPG